ncbi:methyltransferase [Symmachiella dynata]|uniref:methyltransferase n=1 Tax=Symmachiella dynata TaxID=2527995 RepID=UPI0030EC82A3
MPRRSKKSTTNVKTLPTPVQEQLLIDAVCPLLEDQTAERRVLCTTLSRGQAAAAIAAASPAAQVTCHFLDAYLAKLTREFAGASLNFETACSAEFPETPIDLAVIPTHSGVEPELTRDRLQSTHQALVEGGRLAVSTNDPKDSWLHELMQSMFDKVTRIATKKRGVVYIARKTAPLKKLKSFEARFTFPDHDRLTTIVSRPGVFCHRRLDDGARALLKVVEVRDNDRILDMGCGAGAVGLALAARNAKISVTGVDSNARAVWCAEQGATANELANFNAVHTADGSCEGEGSYDLFVGNPPYFSNYQIAELFLQTAVRMLKPGGEIMIVSKSIAWYKQRMAELFDDVGTAESGHYIIAGAVNRRRRK